MNKNLYFAFIYKLEQLFYQKWFYGLFCQSDIIVRHSVAARSEMIRLYNLQTFEKEIKIRRLVVNIRVCIRNKNGAILVYCSGNRCIYYIICKKRSFNKRSPWCRAKYKCKTCEINVCNSSAHDAHG